MLFSLTRSCFGYWQLIAALWRQIDRTVKLNGLAVTVTRGAVDTVEAMATDVDLSVLTIVADLDTSLFILVKSTFSLIIFGAMQVF